MSGTRTPVEPEEETAGRPYDARLVRRLLPDLRPHAPLILASVALRFIALLAGLLQPYLVKVLIDEHVAAGRSAGLPRLAAFYLAAFGVELLARYGQTYTMELCGQNVILALRTRLFAHLHRLDAPFFDRQPVGRLMTRVTTDVESLSDLVSSGVVDLFGDSVKLLAIVGILLWLDARLALVTFSVVPVLFLLSVAFRGRIRRAYREVRRRIARLNAWLQEAISGMLLSQLFRREARDRADFESINRDHRDADLRAVVYESSFSAIVELVGSLAIALIIWHGGGRIVRGALTFGTLVAFLEYTGRFFGPIRDLSGFYALLQAAMASLERIFALLDTRPAIASPDAPAPAGPARGLIEFDAVRFAYRDGEEVLRDLAFTVRPGETVAIVGATGAGKSTLVRLLLRFYDPTAGAIRLDGRDLRTLPLAWLRRHVGAVLQDHFLATGTVADNIAFGDPRLPPEAIAAAARLARADEFIRRLPEGYLAPVRERGANLSLGQKQLISFARAIAYNPEVLVLDEATSSVDPETEALVREALRRLVAGRTSLVIAHRLSTIVGADRILVLHHGRLAEEGTHAALMARRGVYHRLFELQFGADGPAGAPAP